MPWRECQAPHLRAPGRTASPGLSVRHERPLWRSSGVTVNTGELGEGSAVAGLAEAEPGGNGRHSGTVVLRTQCRESPQLGSMLGCNEVARQSRRVHSSAEARPAAGDGSQAQRRTSNPNTTVCARARQAPLTQLGLSPGSEVSR